MKNRTPSTMDDNKKNAPGIGLPTITIVTPSFNQGKYIERTICSVLEQNYPKLEYIVIDGGSTDETLSVLKAYEDRLNWISEKDSGQSEAINKGFRLAKGEIVAWLNSDDVYLPGALEKVGRYFVDHSDVAMVYGEGYMIDENDAIKSRFPFTEPKFDLWKLIYFSDYILQQSTFYRRSIFDSIGMLNESLHYTMDWDLFIRVGKRFRIDYIPEYLGSIREHGEAKTSTGGKTRFREIKGLTRQHGVTRYSLAYFNYAWDTYGKKWFADEPRGPSNGMMARLLALARRVLEFAFARYQKRLQQGCYGDGWVGRRAMLVLPNADPNTVARLLTIEGEAFAPNSRFKVDVRVNKKVARSFQVTEPGTFNVTLTLPHPIGMADSFHIELFSNRSFVPARIGSSTDERQLAFLLKRVEIGCP